MRNPTKLSRQFGIICLGSLAGAFLFCLGCSIHEHNRWGQSEDLVTNFLASGTYISILTFVFSGIAFAVLFMPEEWAGVWAQ
jgi:hypothetical protein